MTAPGSIFLDALARRRGRSVEVTLTAQLPSGTHIEPHIPSEPTLIPTVVEVEGLEEATVEYPEPVRKDLGFKGMSLSVYAGTVRFVIRGKVAVGIEIVRGTVRYQPCVGGACLPPRSLTWEAKLEGTDRPLARYEAPSPSNGLGAARVRRAPVRVSRS